MAQGHGNAAGLMIDPNNVDLAKQRFDELLEAVNFDTPVPCDFVIDVDELDVGFIHKIDKAKWIWGTGVKEPKVAIENIEITTIAAEGKSISKSKSSCGTSGSIGTGTGTGTGT